MLKSKLLDMMVLNEIIGIVGRDHTFTSASDRLSYSLDTYWAPRALLDLGAEPDLPDVVVAPGSVEEVVELIKLANIYRIPVIPFGGGSGSQGAILPVYGGMVIDLKRLKRIIDIDEVSGTVTVQAGIVGYDLEAALNARGWTFPHYPASVHAATIGGSLACRGSGTVSTKYGKAEDLVLSVEVVLPNGDVMRTLPVPNHAAGPGILQNFVGAEGIFGIVTEATLRITPLPKTRRFTAFLFPDLASGMEAGRRIMHADLRPCVMRLYDEVSTIKTVKHVLDLDVSKGAYLVIGFDGFEDIVDVCERRAIEICREFSAAPLGAEAGMKWWDNRYNFYYPPKALDVPWMFGTLDTVTTYNNIMKLYTNKRERLTQAFAEYDLYYYAHFSHWFPWGVMVYDRFVIEKPPQDKEEAIRLHDAVWNMSTAINLEFGGVLNEHHGVGLKLARHVRRQYGAGFQVIEAIKDAVDPHHLMNPGKMGFGPTQ